MQFLSHSTFSFAKKVFVFFNVFVLLNLAVTAHAQIIPSAKSVSGSQNSSASKSSPSQTVLDFYRTMRELRFRDALMMTNLRPAVENLTAQEIEDLRPDFESMATQVPEKIDIAGEQISGNLASVFVKDPNSTSGKQASSEIKLRRENDAWSILSGDPVAEAAAKTEGKNYFFKLHFELRHSEVEGTLNDIVKAQAVYSLQNREVYTDLQTLVKQGTVAAGVLDPVAYGYKFTLNLSPDKKKYTVNAEPTQYGKTGKLSYLLTSGDKKNGPQMMNEDKAGAPVTVKN